MRIGLVGLGKMGGNTAERLLAGGHEMVGLDQGRGWTRLVVEKPFGRDQRSAKKLGEAVHAHFTEEQVRRIDHHLGKETVQNLLVFRYEEAFGALPDAYETLLLDVLTGDRTLFVHADEVEASWEILDHLHREQPAIHTYEAGTWGPAEAGPTNLLDLRE